MRYLAVLLFGLLVTSSAGGNVVQFPHGGGGGGGCGGGTDTITFNNANRDDNDPGTTNTAVLTLNVGSTNPLIAIVVVGDDIAGGSHDDITSVDVDGTQATLITKHTNLRGGERFLYSYYITGKSGVPVTITVTSTNNHFLLIGAASYQNVKQTSPLDAFAANESSGSVTSLNTAVTTIADKAMVVLASAGYGGTFSAGTATTERIHDTHFNTWILSDAGSPTTPAGSVTLQNVMSGSSEMAGIASSFCPN